MLNTLFPASPSPVKQGPNNHRLEKTTTLLVESTPLSTPPIAQEYFEPGVNVARRRRAKPKVDFTLPSDMPEFPPGFVPVNQTPGANGEPPAIIKVPESVPADLLQVFARISAEQKIADAMPKYAVDTGSILMKQFQESMSAVQAERKAESMREKGYTPEETEAALGAVRMERAIQEARAPATSVPVETVLGEVFGAGVAPGRSEIEVQTEISREGGKEIYARAPRRPAAEVAMERAVAGESQPTITKFFGKK